MKKRFLHFLVLCGGLLCGLSSALADFVVEDIRLEGLQRIAPGTVFTYLPIKVGETLDDARSNEVIHTLYQTGFFKDVQLGRDGEMLVLGFIERPSIATIDFSGNEKVTDEQLDMVLKDLGLVEGRIFNPSMLDKIQQELERQYYSQGYYGVKITSDLQERSTNRLVINVTVDEGEVAKIHQVKLIGNQAYSSDQLLNDFELGEPRLFSLFSSRDQYAKQKLVGDLERLRSYYMDRGYIEFLIESTQVSVTPDKQGVYVTINVAEGDQFTVSDVRLAGDLIVDEAELRELLKISAGEVFSRKAVTESSAAISERLGYEGYAFANINAAPDVNKQDKTVALTFFVDPGKRIYVRRINIAGNTKTHDEVIRREVRQMEGGWLSTQKINRTRVRLQRLGYLKEVGVETPSVPGYADLVDVNLNVVEGPSGSLQAGAGYGTNGAIFNLAVAEQNFLGTGQTAKLSFDNSSSTTTYNLSYTNPYFTLDGVSRSFNLYSTTTDAAAANVAAYNTDVLGGSVVFGFPLSEYNTARLGLVVEGTNLRLNDETPRSIVEWSEENGRQFDVYKLTGSWSHDARNRTLFANDGMLQRLSADVTVPGSDVEFFKIQHKQTWYFPMFANTTLSLSSELGYGEGLRGTSELPFFENFYLGGVTSVRGFSRNSLGPTETWAYDIVDADNDGDKEIADGSADYELTRTRVVGGHKKIQGSLELIFPSPFAEYEQSFRWSYFIDGGNVFGSNQQVSLDELRFSHGLAIQWLTPVGILSFSFGWPLRSEPDDELERFQFTIGAPF